MRVHIGQWEKRDVNERSFEQNIEETVSEWMAKRND